MMSQISAERPQHGFFASFPCVAGDLAPYGQEFSNFVPSRGEVYSGGPICGVSIRSLTVAPVWQLVPDRCA